MDGRSLRGLFVTAVAAQLAIFLVSLPGFGIETRKASDYSAWAGPLFLVLTLLVFLLGVVSLLLLRSRTETALRLGFGQALVAIATNLLDISHAGGPAPPAGPLALGLASIAMAILTVGVVSSWVARQGRR